MEKDFKERTAGGRHDVGGRHAVGGGDAGDNEIESNDTPIADRYQVVVHVTAETFEIEDGPHVTAETSRRIGCNAKWYAGERMDWQMAVSALFARP
jgi:hypothetical protein